MVITIVAVDALTEFFLWEEIDNLGENGLAFVHGMVPFGVFPSGDHKTMISANSNRSLYS